MQVFIDSRSIDLALKTGNQSAITLLKYSNSRVFEFIRSPFQSDENSLLNVPEYKISNLAPPAVRTIDAQTGRQSRNALFPYLDSDINATGCYVFNVQSLSPNQLDRMLQVFVQAVFNRNSEGTNLFVTEDRDLLRKRLWFESHFPGTRLNIVTSGEACEIMDLFAKYNDIYLLASNFITSKWLVYWLSFRTKIPFFHVPIRTSAASSLISSNYLDGFSSRFVYLLMAVDELGTQHYLGVNNNTEENSMYHFNYANGLISGVFDALALETRQKLTLSFERDDIPWKISLSNDTGGDFLRALRDVNEPLRNHINQYVEYINLINELRQLSVHREGFQKVAYAYRGQEGETWTSIFIPTGLPLANRIKTILGANLMPYTSLTTSGVHEIPGMAYLHPFYFIKSATSKLVDFSSRFLELLGYPNYIASVSDRPFKTQVEQYATNKLGF